MTRRRHNGLGADLENDTKLTDGFLCLYRSLSVDRLRCRNGYDVDTIGQVLTMKDNLLPADVSKGMIAGPQRGSVDRNTLSYTISKRSRGRNLGLQDECQAQKILKVHLIFHDIYIHNSIFLESFRYDAQVTHRTLTIN